MENHQVPIVVRPKASLKCGQTTRKPCSVFHISLEPLKNYWPISNLQHFLYLIKATGLQNFANPFKDKGCFCKKLVLGNFLWVGF